MIECIEDEETFRSRKPHNRFYVWKGSEFWRKTLSVQVRLEEDGSIFLSTQEGHVSTLRIGTTTIEQLHAAIRAMTSPPMKTEPIIFNSVVKPMDCYVGIKQCGCMVAWVHNSKEHPKDVAKSVAQFIKDGYRIESANTDEIRSKLGPCKCS